MQRRPQTLSTATVLLCLLAAVVPAGKARYRAEGSLHLEAVRSNGTIAIRFDIESDMDEPEAELIFRLQRPGEAIPEGTRGERTAIALREGTSSSHTFEFTPGGPGRHAVYAVVAASGRGWRRGFEECVFIDVPAGGGAPTLSFVPIPPPPERGNGPTEWDAPADRLLECEPASPPNTSAAPRAGAFKVKGTFKYTDRKYLDGAFTGTQSLPIRNAFIRILEVEPGDTTQEIGFTYTNELGAFSYTVPDNSDGPPSEGKRDIRIEVNADSADAYVSYLDSTVSRGSILGDYENWPGGDLNIGTFTFSQPFSPAFNIMDNAQQAQAFARSKGESTARMRLRWESGQIDGSYFTSATTAITIGGGASNPDEFDDDVILHECGHYMMNRFSFDRSPGGPHFLDGLYDPRLAWSEGWATYFAGMVDYNRYYVDHTASDFFGYSIETNTEQALGDRNEVAVTSALWDIYDGAVDGMDTLSDGSQRSWNIFTGFTVNKNATFRDFYDKWKLTYDKLDRVQAITKMHGMDFEAAQVTYPNASGIAITIGNPASIKWTGFPGTNVRIDMVRSGSPDILVVASTPNDGSFLWTPPASTPTGAASIRVYGTSQQFTYYDLSDNPFTVVPKPEKLTLNSSKTGSLTGVTDQDWYSIGITKGANYTITTFSGTLTDSLLRLNGPNTPLTPIATDDDSGTGNMSRIVRYLNPGTYYFEVRAVGAGQAGTYSIRVSN